MFALVLCALFVTSQGHMCLFSPYQRGGPVSHTDINTKGADPCALTTGPCGGVNASDSEGTSFMQGEKISVVMQKNLDHYYCLVFHSFILLFFHSVYILSMIQ